MRTRKSTPAASASACQRATWPVLLVVTATSDAGFQRLAYRDGLYVLRQRQRGVVVQARTGYRPSGPRRTAGQRRPQRRHVR